MDLQSKERLTGAIILVVLIVLIVPELLTGPRRAVAPERTAIVEGAPMRQYTIELGDGAARPAQPMSSTAPGVEGAATDTVARANPPASQAAAAAAPAPVAPADTPVALASDAATRQLPAVTGWSIQVGSFASRENADRLAGELRRLGFASFIAEGTSSGRRLYRVRVGPEGDRAAAQALAGRLKAAGRPGSIVPHP